MHAAFERSNHIVRNIGRSSFAMAFFGKSSYLNYLKHCSKRDLNDYIYTMIQSDIFDLNNVEDYAQINDIKDDHNT